MSLQIPCPAIPATLETHPVVPTVTTRGASQRGSRSPCVCIQATGKLFGRTAWHSHTSLALADERLTVSGQLGKDNGVGFNVALLAYTDLHFALTSASLTCGVASGSRLSGACSRERHTSAVEPYRWKREASLFSLAPGLLAPAVVTLSPIDTRTVSAWSALAAVSSTRHI
jgi:hypothetical protein